MHPDLRAYASVLYGQVFHYRDSSGLEVDAIVELHGGDCAAFEVKMDTQSQLDLAARNLLALRAKLSDYQRSRLKALTILTGGTTSYRRPDGVNVVSLGHLTS